MQEVFCKCCIVLDNFLSTKNISIDAQIHFIIKSTNQFRIEKFEKIKINPSNLIVFLIKHELIGFSISIMHIGLIETVKKIKRFGHHVVVALVNLAAITYLIRCHQLMFQSQSDDYHHSYWVFNYEFKAVRRISRTKI